MITEWLDIAKTNHPHLNADLIRSAGKFADQISHDHLVPFASSALQQGLAMADELLGMNCDSETIAAAIVFPSIYYHNPSAIDAEKMISAPVYQLAKGVKKMDAIQQTSETFKNDRQLQADNLRKMCLAMVDDVRIVLIKLAEQLSIVKYLRHCSASQQQHIAQQIANIYAPLANRLGVGHLKWQLEDLSFRYLNPTEYKKISQGLKMRRFDREIFINQMIQQLHQTLNEHGIQAEITGRAKHIYSIFRKIQRKQVDLTKIYDTSALRILVDSIEECYQALSIVHTAWPHIPSEFDDYIVNPKSNGYRSIHTVIVCRDNINVEIQIRTIKMHEESELGVAAHWQYKESKGQLATYTEKINWLRHVMDWQKETISPQGENLYKKIFEDRIYVFTPDGDVFDLEQGATPLDFAYHVHTDIGHRCRGAKVNNVMAPLTYELHTGDQVSILTGKESQPSRDWINPTTQFLKTNAAKHKVRSWFKRQEQQNHLHQGMLIWEKMCRREGIAKNEIENAFTFYKFKNAQELLMALGSGMIGVISVINRLKNPEGEELKKPSPAPPVKKIEKVHTPTKGGLQIEGVGNLLTHLAHCCQPIPGDLITGYVTKGRGVAIHQQACPNITHTLKRYPERLLQVTWGDKQDQIFPVTLLIESEDRPGLIRDITQIIAAEKLSLLGLNTRVDKLDNKAYITLTVELKSLNPLHKLLSELQRLPNIYQIRRV